MKKLALCASLLLALLIAAGLTPLDPLAAVAQASGPIGSAGPGGGLGPSDEIPIGCTSTPGTNTKTGPESRRDVALSFDDGPKPTQTIPILATLEQLHATATFFEEGRHVATNESLMSEILAAGDEIGNHSYDHPKYPDAEELSSTDRLIHSATGFEPCLFRPPYGLLNSSVESNAAADNLQTVLWTIDAGDDHHFGPRAVASHAIHRARPGAIILMHDGGHHPQTVQALPTIIEGLRARHFHLVTVTALLGGRFLFRG